MNSRIDEPSDPQIVLETTSKQGPTHPPTIQVGLLMLVLAVVIVVLSNFLSFELAGFFGLAIAFFLFMAGLGVLMMGVVQGQNQKVAKKETENQTQIIREIVKVRCGHCGALNFETSNRCTNCGANL